MTGDQVIARVTAAGGRLRIEGNRILITGTNDPDIIALLREHRQAVAAVLRKRRSEASPREIYESRMALRDALAREPIERDAYEPPPFELPPRRTIEDAIRHQPRRPTITFRRS